MIPYENGLAPAEAGTQPDGGTAVQGESTPLLQSNRVTIAPPYVPLTDARVDAILDRVRAADENATDGTPYALTYLVAE